MDISDVFEAFATSKGWGYEYARRDYQNMIDATDFVADAIEGYGVGETMMIVDPVIRVSEKQGISYRGSFMVLTKSDLDDDYTSRKTKYIDPLLDILLKEMRSKLICDYDVNQWEAIELINMLDWNADGLLITFNLKGFD